MAKKTLNPKHIEIVRIILLGDNNSSIKNTKNKNSILFCLSTLNSFFILKYLCQLQPDIVKGSSYSAFRKWKSRSSVEYRKPTLTDEQCFVTWDLLSWDNLKQGFFSPDQGLFLSPCSMKQCHVAFSFPESFQFY